MKTIVLVLLFFKYVSNKYKGKVLVDKVTGLIAIFENPKIDFRSNVASDDDIISDAYEYFMMKFT